MADFRAKSNFILRLDDGDEITFATGRVYRDVAARIADHWFFKENAHEVTTPAAPKEPESPQPAEDAAEAAAAEAAAAEAAAKAKKAGK